MDKYDINILGLKNSIKEINLKLDKDFFKLYGHEFLAEGTINANIIVKENTKKHIISLTFNLKGEIKLICDRSLNDFFFPIDINKKVIFEFGDKDEELDIDYYMVKNEMTHINIAQHLYDFIILEVPIKKLHPKYNSDILKVYEDA